MLEIVFPKVKAPLLHRCRNYITNGSKFNKAEKVCAEWLEHELQASILPWENKSINDAIINQVRAELAIKAWDEAPHNANIEKIVRNVESYVFTKASRYCAEMSEPSIASRIVNIPETSAKVLKYAQMYDAYIMKRDKIVRDALKRGQNKLSNKQYAKYAELDKKASKCKAKQAEYVAKYHSQIEFNREVANERPEAYDFIYCSPKE